MMRDESMDLQTKTLSSSSFGIRSQRSRTKLPSKQSTQQLRLHKQSSQTKLDKRRSGGEYQQSEQLEIEKVFRLHARSKINEEQALFSLKLLGFVCNTGDDYSRFHKIWSRYGCSVDEDGFKSLSGEVKSRGEMRDHSACFNILTQGKMVLDANRLALLGVELGQNIDGIIEQCGKDGIIDFTQFDSILKFTNALT